MTVSMISRRAIESVVIAAVLIAVLVLAGGSAAAGNRTAVGQIKIGLHGKWRIYPDGSGVYVYVMRLTGLPAGTRAAISCVQLCTTHESLIAPAGGTVVSKRFRNRKLQRGTIVAIRATRAGYNGSLDRLVIVADPKSKTVYRTTTRCIASGRVSSGPTCVSPPERAGLVAPTRLRLSSFSYGGFTLSWTGSPAATGYRVYLNGDAVSTQPETSYTYSGLGCGATYTLSVDAYDAKGSTERASTMATTIPCGPGGLKVVSPTRTTLTLTWGAQPGSTGYHVYLNGTRVASVSGLSYVATGLHCGTYYTFSLSAFDPSGTSAQTEANPASTLSC